jgi:cell filamentation protein
VKNDIYDEHFDDEYKVLRNTLHLTDSQALETAIADLSRVRLVELQASRVKGKFDIPHIRAIHRYIF